MIASTTPETMSPKTAASETAAPTIVPDTGSTILDKIVSDKASQLEQLKQQYPLAEIKKDLAASERSLFEALNQPQAGFILECKKASPSKGLIRDDFNLPEIVGTYKKYAAALSVLTDEKYFQGRFEYVRQVRELVDLPIINKDFFTDPYQIYLARYMGADAILLMLSVLDDLQYQSLATVADELGMDILTEVSNEEELSRALALDVKILGINNRDLRDLSTDLNTTKRLAPAKSSERLVISESGIYTHQQVRELAPYANGFLVGSSLMAQDDVDQACRQLLFGNNKVCGLTRMDDVRAVAQSGAVYGGLIFAEKSPRYVDLATAKTLTATDTGSSKLKFVGVFVKQPLEQVAQYAHTLGLSVVQLHGGESDDYITRLASHLPASCQIWQVIRADNLPKYRHPQVDRWLIDSVKGKQLGGTGETFDWHSVDPAIREQSMLAGGLSPDNISTACTLGFAGMDANSGVESAPGLKDQALIQQLFARIRDY